MAVPSTNIFLTNFFEHCLNLTNVMFEYFDEHVFLILTLSIPLTLKWNSSLNSFSMR